VKVYVASSWRNEAQPAVVRLLRAEGHEVYDFRNPADGVRGFQWSQIDLSWQGWDASAFRQSLDDPIAVDGFRQDMDALRWCDVCVLILPCGRSAHLELGWAVGAGKRTVALLVDGEPELMYRMVDHLCVSVEELTAVLR
jgi:hypothetical protein